MSDSGPGNGWWQASDGHWYPPEQHPDNRPDLPPPPPATAAASAPQVTGAEGNPSSGGDPSPQPRRVSKLVPLALSAVITAAYLIWPDQIIVFGFAAAIVVVVAGVLVRPGEKVLAIAVACLVPVFFAADWAQQNREMQHLIDATFETESALERFVERADLAFDVFSAKENTQSAWDTLELDLNRAARDQLEDVLVARAGVDDVLVLPWHRDLAAAQASNLAHISEWEKHLEDWATWNWENDFPSNPRINSTFRIAEQDYLDAVTIFPFPGIEKDIVDLFDE